MSDTQTSPQRSAAEMHLGRAKQHLQKSKYDRAIDEGYQALQTDPDFDDARIFLAETHELLGESRKAVTQYEALFFRDVDKEAMLAKIEELDPATAQRHRRVANLAPDPFVGGGRTSTNDDEFLDDDDMIDASPTGASVHGVGTPTPQGATGDYLDDDDEFLDARPPSGVAPEQYQYDDEEEVRRQTVELPAVRESLARQRDVWGDESPLAWLLEQTQSLSDVVGARGENTYNEIASLLGTPLTTPLVFEDDSVEPLVCGPRCRYVVFPKGAFQALSGDEIKFLIARTLSRIACEHQPLLDVAAALLPPPPQPSAIRDIQLRAAAEDIGGPAQLGEEDTTRSVLKALHRWRLRAEISADRAGLVGCTMIKAAVTAMAKLTAKDAMSAATTGLEQLKERFAGQDLGKLAAIAVDQDPSTNEAYAFYRMSMLVWWSKQTECQQLIARGT